jgi:ectoine hydroxylase
VIVRNLRDLPRDANVVAETWTSRRLLVAADAMGFSLHDTVLNAGTTTAMHYKNHVEAVYCIEGTGELEDLSTGEKHVVAPGVVYALDKHDRHVLTAWTALRVVCVFSPPIVGPETHDADGSYPLLRVPAPAADPYVSRCDEAWGTTRRADPVVWGEGPGPLGPDRLERYARDGFLVLDDVLDPGLAEELCVEAERLAGAADRGVVVSEPDSDAVRSVFRAHRDSEPFSSLVRHPRLAGAARQLLGSEVYVHQSRINYKPALDGRPFSWHSDFETWHVEDGMPRMRAVTAVVMLTPSTPLNGPLLLLPGSHRTFVRCAGRTPEDHHLQSLRSQEYGVPPAEVLRGLSAGGIEAATGKPGTVVLFDCNTLHASSGNPTPWPRTSFFAVYNSVENALGAPLYGLRPRPMHLAERHVEPLGE